MFLGMEKGEHIRMHYTGEGTYIHIKIIVEFEFDILTYHHIQVVVR